MDLSKISSFVMGAVLLLVVELAQAADNHAIEAHIKKIATTYAVPGMAVAVTVRGVDRVYTLGTLSPSSKKPVNADTLFEVGSLTKTMTATLAAYLDVTGDMHLSERISQYIPTLRGSAFDDIKIAALATHTSGLSLYIPATIRNKAQLYSYYNEWHGPDRRFSRIYSNLGMGLLGFAMEEVLKLPFDLIARRFLFEPLGMMHTRIDLNPADYENYAYGRDRASRPARLSKVMLAPAAYGVKSSAQDMLTYIKAQINGVPKLQGLNCAILKTHEPKYATKYFTQDLGWEHYTGGISLEKLLDGSSHYLRTSVKPSESINSERVYYNKTGQTNGFSAYTLFSPQDKAGIVVLANSVIPVEARIRLAYTVLRASSLVSKPN